MKKITIVVSALLIACNVSGQKKSEYILNSSTRRSVELKYSNDNALKYSTIPAKSLGDTIWSEDFANGIPSTWKNTGTVNGSGTPIPDADVKWEYRGLTTTPDTGTASRGGCAKNVPHLVSPSANNGYIIFDSNYLDDISGVCPPTGPAGSAPAPHTGTLETNAINLSGKTSIALKFFYFASDFKSTQTVKISTDGGTTWTEIWEAELEVNKYSYIDDRVSINISCYAANQADVRFQFVFEGEYYFWMLDDIAIVEVNKNDLVLEEAFTAPLDSMLENTFMPLQQAMVQPYILNGTVTSYGAVTQNNVSLNVEVYKGASQVFNNTGTPISLLCDTGSVSVDEFTPTTTGTYNAFYWGSSDSINSDSLLRTFVVTDSEYGRDNMWDASKIDNTITLGANCGTQEIGYPFQIFIDANASSISTYLSSKTSIKAVVYGIIYEIDVNGDKVMYKRTPDYQLTGIDISKRWFSASFTEEVSLIAGNAYFACIGGLIGSDTSIIVTAGKIKNAYSYIHDVDGGCETNGVGWYVWDKAPVVRLNTKDFNAITDLSLQRKTEIYPNPTTGKLNVNFKNINKDNYVFELRNILGQLIYEETLPLTGNASKSLDFSMLHKGIYFLNIRNSDSETTQKIVIK